MARKIYDIKPPKVVHKTEHKTLAHSGVKITRQKPAHVAAHTVAHSKRQKVSVLWPVLICALVVVVMAGTYLYFKLPKADITIWPKVDVLNFAQTVTADKTANSVDIVKNIIPAKYFEATKTNSQTFPATGNASNVGLASGTITIYNKYDPPTPFTFKAGTHFMSDSGKLFVALQKITIPSARKSGSKITPGSVQVQIQAVEGGTGYNIAPSNFSIPGLKGTAYYYSVYATSTSAMSGGYSGNVKKVTDDDIQEARNVLTQKTTADAMAALKNQISSDYVLLDNAALSHVTSASTPTKSGAIADNFNYQVAVTASALAFKKSDIEQFSKDYFSAKIPDGKTLVSGSLKPDYSASLVDISGGKATLNFNISGKVYQQVDTNSLTLSLLGKNTSQASQTISSVMGDQVENVKIKFWPFWVTSVPSSQKAVSLGLKFQ